MSDALDSFIDKKNANSEYVSLESGESAVLKIREIKTLTKAGYGGEEKETLRLIVDIETSEGIRVKKFDNSSQKFANSLREIRALIPGGNLIGASIKVTREGVGTSTKYAVALAGIPGQTA